MPTRCSICEHPRRAEIERVTFSAGPETELLEVCERYRVTKVALRRHAKHVVPPSAGALGQSGEPPRGEDAASEQPLDRGNVVPFPRASASAHAPAVACAVCAHPKRADIESAIGAGEVWSKVGRRFLLDVATLKEHAEGCLLGELRRPPAKGDAQARCLALLERVEELIEKVERDETTVGEKTKLFTAAKGLLELLGRFTGELGATSELVIVESPRWKRIEAAITKALEPHPAAASAVAKALKELEAA